MHEEIMQWPSDKLYQGKLQAAVKVANHLLKDLPGVTENEITLAPIMFGDTSGLYFSFFFDLFIFRTYYLFINNIKHLLWLLK